jgi:hypothetical protein
MALSEQQRSKILDEELLRRVSQGAKVQARTPTSAVVVSGQPVNHVLHLLISVFLCGLWLPVWILAAATGGEYRRMVTVDEHGAVVEPKDKPVWIPLLITVSIAAGILFLLWVIAQVMHMH